MDIELPSEKDLKAIFQVKRYILLPTVTVIVVIGLLAFFVGPSVRKIINTRKEVSKDSEKLASLKKKVESLEGFDESLLIEQVEVLEQALPSKKDVLGLMTTLNGLAEDNDVSLGNYKLSPGSIATEAATPSATKSTAEPQQARERKSGFDSIVVAVNLSGPLEGVGTFLSGVEHSWPLMKLTKLSLNPLKRRVLELDATQSASDRIGVTLELDLFYASLPKQLGTIGKPIASLSEREQELYDEISQYLSYEVDIPQVPTGVEDPFSSF
jgi:hypothetical protein